MWYQLVWRSDFLSEGYADAEVHEQSHAAFSAMKREQVNQLGEAAKNDPVIKPYPSFYNLSEGKIVCLMEAP
jgi:hypothetical protein